MSRATRRTPDLPRRRPRRRQDVRDAGGGPAARRTRHRRGGRPASRPTAGAHTAAMIGDLEVVPRARRSPTGAPSSPRWTWTPCWPGGPRSPWSTSSPTPTCPAPATPSAGRTSRSSSTPASPCSPRSTSSTSNRSTTSSPRSPASPQRETVPDEVVRAAEQVELVDMTPEALRRRMAHGNIYQPDKIDAALGNYFRVGNLTALRELALLWLADKVDEQLDRYRAQQGISATWEARERVVVALTGGPEGDDADPPRGPDRRPQQGRRPAGRARRPQRRAGRRRPGPARPAAGAGGKPRRHLPPGRSAPTSRRRCWTSPAASTPPSSSSAPAGAAGSRSCSPAASGVTTTAAVRADRRAPGHPPRGRAGPARRRGAGGTVPATPAARLRARRAAACRCSPCCCRRCPTSP